jgi:hypothetical protein
MNAMRDFRATPPGKIGTHGLVGCIRGDLVLIGGPDGGDHILSAEAALELRDWISRNVTPRDSRGLEADVRSAEAGFDPSKRTAADALQIQIFDALESDKHTEADAWRAALKTQADAWAAAEGKIIQPTGTI